ncbi:MAG: S1 RNA-binding domain-containing protein, partial [Rikenellaceae bacterium]|nr:S1 RNA-binding domain-containing protein [Rikenellaceae bacterium]
MEENKVTPELETPEVAAEQNETIEEIKEIIAEQTLAPEEAPADVVEKIEMEEKEAEIAKETPAPKKEKAAKKAEAAEEKPAATKNEDFDWNAFENDLGIYDTPKEAITEKYDNTLSNVQVGEVVEGTVTSINKREAVVNIGYKSDAVIPIAEFRYNPELALGEKVEVYVESAEDKKGQLVLSHKKARQLRSWDRVNKALDNDEIIKGYIKCRTKGGMIVDVFGIEAFLPG